MGLHFSTVIIASLAVLPVYLYTVQMKKTYPGQVRTTSSTPMDSSLDISISSPLSVPKKILVPLPTVGFDPTEMAVPVSYLKKVGHTIVFATPDGKPSEGADPYTLCGFVFGLLFKIFPEPKALYEQVIDMPEYANPISYSDIVPNEYDGVFLTGGHAPGMKSYLANSVLLDKVGEFFELKRPVAAICHGVLVLARAKDKNGNSLLYKRRATSLLSWLEVQAYLVTHYLVGIPAKEYQLSTTWPLYTEDEVRSSGIGELVVGPYDILAPLTPGTASDHTHAFVVEDLTPNMTPLITARFWSDVYLFSQRFDTLLNNIQSNDVPVLVPAVKVE